MILQAGFLKAVIITAFYFLKIERRNQQKEGNKRKSFFTGCQK